jgi:hypothetical protein
MIRDLAGTSDALARLEADVLVIGAGSPGFS